MAAADSGGILADALAAEKRFDSKTALDLFLTAEKAKPDDSLVLQKIARQYSDLTLDTTDVAEKKRLCTLALDYSKKAVAANPKDPVNVLSLAICYGKLGGYSDTRTKIEYSRLVKQHAEEALALDPNYDYAHHVLGQWNYSVATLGAASKFFVKLIYGGLPDATTAAGVKFLQRSVELAPQLPSHKVELGFAYLADKQTAAAKKVLEEALAMPKVEKYDDEAKARAREALAKL
jgi:tetratricopeptide (TPR) repeat protein